MIKIFVWSVCLSGDKAGTWKISEEYVDSISNGVAVRKRTVDYNTVSYTRFERSLENAVFAIKSTIEDEIEKREFKINKLKEALCGIKS